jgi:hypothetical protein
MRLKSYGQRALMLGFMVGVGLQTAWPDRQLMVLIVMAGIAAGLCLLLPRDPNS